MRRFEKKIRNFCKNTSGNVSIMFAVGITMLVVCIGAAIDYSGIVSKKSKLQDLADRATLLAATSGLEEEAELQALVNEYANDTEFSSVELILTLTENNTVVVQAKEPYKMIIMGAFNHDDKGVEASAEAPLAGEVRVNLSLVLDTTASMNENNRMTALKLASSELIDELKESNNDGSENVRLSLVPFADYVRISTENRGASWLEIQPDQEVTWNVLDGENSVNCRQVGEGETAYTECDETVYIEKTEFLEWEGCMGSRMDNYHTVVDFSAGRRMQGFVAHGSCNALNSALEPLTADLDSIGSSIQAMNPKGSTYIPAGLMWGWRTLNSKEPFSNTYNDQSDGDAIRNVLVLMTDGNNTLRLANSRPDFNGLYHYAYSDEVAETKELTDSLSSQICTSIKQDNIQIITIAFEIEEASTKTMLQNCASSAGDFYDATNASQLKQAFKDIGSGLNTLRLMR